MTLLASVVLGSVFALASAVLPTNYVTSAVLPTNYVTLTAEEKQALQWNQVLATRYNLNELPSTFPQPTDNLTLLGMPEYLAQTFIHTGDEMPAGRSRMTISPFAVVCKMEYRTFKNSTTRYTGLFHTGGIGLIRISLDAIYGPPLSKLFSPTAVLKIYIPGKISRNLHHIKDLVGQGNNHNFFLNSMSNIMEMGKNDPEAVLDGFSKTIKSLPGDALSRPVNPYTLGLFEQASVNGDGTNVSGVIVAPWEHRLQPHAGLATPSDSTNDFRLDLIGVLKAGTVVYDVHARGSEDSKVKELIGEIVLQSECVPSKYGDEGLFFRQSAQQWRANHYNGY
ncbi:hypothetical protein BV898_10058 [Hypsibius exemplaris]|uniref:Uncharacterized protein n=1 Tax=Hypsibius exemplaris TaxID=2072580 RepID=A0A1W0WKT5_HYPEX|nr:hypothetical protein BV898_10058 [Hypsibius exemplaris]